jgi:HlyD family secretion protein
MAAKLVLSVATMVAMLAVIWQAGGAGWVRPEADIHARAGAPAVPTRRAGTVIAEGRLVTYPGAEVVVAAELGGTIVRLVVQEKSSVRKGDLIAELRSDELRASRDEAVARIDEAEAEARFYEREVERRRVLIATGAASDVELESNQRGLDVSRARRRGGSAARDHLDAQLAKTRITAPIDGVVIARFANPGETIDAAARLVTLADLTRVRVEAEVDEVDFGGITLGAEATVSAEGFPGQTWQGRVEEVPDVVVGRHLRPEDTGRPVDTRVLLVKIALLVPTPLKLGQRIEVEIVNRSH